MIERMFWRGTAENGAAEASARPFLVQGDRPGELVIWWLEPTFDGMCDLVVSRELTTSDPIRVRPGEWLAFDGVEFRRPRVQSAAP